MTSAPKTSAVWVSGFEFLGPEVHFDQGQLAVQKAARRRSSISSTPRIFWMQAVTRFTSLSWPSTTIVSREVSNRSVSQTATLLMLTANF